MLETQRRTKQGKQQVDDFLKLTSPPKLFGQGLDRFLGVAQNELYDPKAVKPLTKLAKAALNSERSRNEDFIRVILAAEVKQTKKDLDDLNTQMKKVLEAIESAMTRQNLVALDGIMIKAALEGKKPGFISTYEGWQQLGLEIPVTAPKGEKVIEAERPVSAAQSPDDLTARISRTLAFLRGQAAERDRLAEMEVFRLRDLPSLARTAGAQAQTAVQDYRAKRKADYDKVLGSRHYDNLPRQAANDRPPAGTSESALKDRAQRRAPVVDRCACYGGDLG